jgi:NTE family protein
MKTFALALGSGGARGLAHIAVIEALDEMGIRPAAIAGTSIGALIGSAYAAGLSGRDIRHHVIGHAHNRGETTRRLLAARAGRFADLFAGALGQAAQLDAEKFCAQFLPPQVPADFADLSIPLIVMATDLHARSEAALSSGALHPALAASIAIPGLFRPVALDGRILVDGGATNPLPFDRLAQSAERIVAVDVFGVPPTDRSDVPGGWECVAATINVMGSAILSAKLQRSAPDLMIRPNVTIFHAFDFYQASAIVRIAEAEKATIKEKLGALLGE